MTEALMEYLPPIQLPQAPSSGADKYHGTIAQDYDARRVADPKWQIEQQILEAWIDELPEGAAVLDAPVGTGRLMEAFARRKLNVWALDKSKDMLQQAVIKANGLGFNFHHALGNVLQVPLDNQSVDATFSIRISRWLSPEENQQMFREMQRVSRGKVIWTARVANHMHARSRELYEAALLPGWQIMREVEGYQPEYKILCAEKVA